jgi:hypothetical protein
MEWELVPHVGLLPHIRLGATAADVTEALRAAGFREPTRKGSSLLFFADAGVEVEFGSDGRASFIGVFLVDRVHVLFQGVRVLDTDALQVFGLLSRSAGGVHVFNASEYLWRPLVATVFNAAPRRASDGSEKMLFDQVGIGSAEYLAQIDALKSGV